MQIKFGTDGWRGRIARDFTFDNVRSVLQAFCDIFVESSQPQLIYLGYDRRFLSREFAEAAAEVLTANGIEVHLARQFCPTPCISWMTKEFKAGAGIMITASHNPHEWNGIKFKEPDGGAAAETYTGPIENRVVANSEQGRQPQTLSLEIARDKGLLKDFDPLGPYVEHLQSMIDVEAICKAGWNVVADSMYGAGSGYFAAVLGDGVKELHDARNPSFNGVQPEPIEKNLSELLDQVGAKGVDIGLATDGDADRIGAGDENGRYVNSHHIFALLLKHLVENRGETGEVVKTVSTTQMIDKLCEKYGLKIHQTAIGFKHICTKFHEISPMIGGEESGGIAIARHIPERDGILSGLLLLELMTQEKKSLSKLITELEADIGTHRFARVDLALAADKINEIRRHVTDFSRETLAGLPIAEILRIDGCRLNLADGSWVLIRASGTEPLLRLYAEAESNERVQELLQAIRQELAL